MRQVLSSFEAAAENKGAFLVASRELAAGARAAAKVRRCCYILYLRSSLTHSCQLVWTLIYYCTPWSIDKHNLLQKAYTPATESPLHHLWWGRALYVVPLCDWEKTDKRGGLKDIFPPSEGGKGSIQAG